MALIELVLKDMEWGQAEPLLKRATDYFDSGLNTHDIYQRVLSGQMQLWKVGDWDAAAVTQIQHFPQFQSLLVCYLGGDNLTDWFDDLMEAVEMAGKEWGCKYVEAHGRRGWLRVGRARGYEEMTTVSRKAI